MPDSSTPAILERLTAALREDYEIIRPLGRGGMASVFLARERSLNRLVALKVLDPMLGEGPLFRARFYCRFRFRRNSAGVNRLETKRRGFVGACCRRGWFRFGNEWLAPIKYCLAKAATHLSLARLELLQRDAKTRAAGRALRHHAHDISLANRRILPCEI